MSELLSRLLVRGSDGGSAAIVDETGYTSYASLVARSRRIAAGLVSDLGTLGPLDARFAILAPSGALFASALFGVLFGGGTAVVLSPLHPLREAQYICDDAGIRGLLVAEPFSTFAEGLGGKFHRFSIEDLADGRRRDGDEEVSANAPALMLYTSGTTGRPKGAVLTHANLAIQQKLVAEAWGFGPHDVLLHALPLHHMHGLAIAFLTAIGAGATTMMTKFDAAAIWEQMSEASVFMGVPAMYHRLFAAFDAANALTRARWTTHAKMLRLATSGSAALPVGLAERWRALTGKIPLERFGMTEIGVGISNRLDGERFPGCVGFPLPTVETRIVGDDGADAETGELWIRGPSVFAGYHGKEEETKKAFEGDWFKTGDTVTREAKLPGAPFKILGRTSVDILKSGGYKLSALEIEEVLREHAAVSEIAVVGIPDEAWGERVVACVVRRPGEEADEAGLKAFAKERLAAYKVPKQVLFLDELPKNALGKVVKPDLVRVLRATLA